MKFYSLLSEKAVQLRRWLLFIILFSALFAGGSYAQDQRRFLLDEISISINKTMIPGNSLSDSYGFGVGTKLLLNLDKKLDLITGAEYNRTRQFVKLLYFSHFTSFHDVSCAINCVSIPIGIRYNVGSKSAFFIESGIFSDFILLTTEKGMLFTDLPDKPVTNTEYFKRRGLSFSPGIYAAAGFVVPFSHFKLLIKPEFKVGLTEIYPNSDKLTNRYFKINFGLRLN